MGKLESSIEKQKEAIKQGGWRKYLGYIVLGALLCLVLAATLLRSFFLRKQLAEAKTEAAIAEEALLQDEVDDLIEDLSEDIESEEEEITRREKRLSSIDAEEVQNGKVFMSYEEALEEIKTWEDIKAKVRWDDKAN